MDGEGAWFSPKTSGVKRRCCVPKCNSASDSSPHLRFHAFPKEGEIVTVENGEEEPKVCDRREYWVNALKVPEPVAKNMFVCSRHFLRSDYLLPDHAAKQRHLKRVAVPTLNLPSCSPAVKDLWKCGSQSGQRLAMSRKKVLSVPPYPDIKTQSNSLKPMVESKREVSQLIGKHQESKTAVMNIKKERNDLCVSYPVCPSEEEVITDDIPSQEMLMPVPVKLVEVSTGKEIHFNEPSHCVPEEKDEDTDEPECLNVEEGDNIFEPKIVLIPQKVEDADYEPTSSEEDEDDDFP